MPMAGQARGPGAGDLTASFRRATGSPNPAYDGSVPPGRRPLPVEALDHATGYLMPAVVIRALVACGRDAPVADARVSLARTAELLAAHPQDNAIAANPAR